MGNALADKKTRSSWVWVSNAQSVKDGTVSVLAVAETIAASCFGFWAWFQWGLYPLLLTSACMAFLTMLRSNGSLQLGVRWFSKYTNEFDTGSSLITIHSIFMYYGVLLSFLGLQFFTINIYNNIIIIDLDSTSGIFRIILEIIYSLFVFIMCIFSALIFIVKPKFMDEINNFENGGFYFKLLLAIFIIILLISSSINIKNGLDAMIETLHVIWVFGGVLGGAVAIPLLLPALLIRSAATIFHFKSGILNFSSNWTSLVTSIDLFTEVELVPGLPDRSTFRIATTIETITRGLFHVKFAGAVILIICFLPTWIFRFTLKSTFLIYWPLLFIASSPRSRKSKTGALIWDDTFGKTALAWIAVLVAVATLIAIGSTIYDPSFVASFVGWADPRGLPSHILLQAFGFRVWELDVWEWLALTASIITVAIFIWANAINLRHAHNGYVPGWAVLKAFYALNRIKTVCVIATVLAAFFAVTWFVHDTCTLPDWISQVLAYVFGMPSACIPPTPPLA